MTHVNTLCERLLARFILVEATFLLVEPFKQMITIDIKIEYIHNIFMGVMGDKYLK